MDLDCLISRAVAACPFSAQIMAAGFRAEHNGGGCLHWVKDVGEGWQLWLSDVDAMDLGDESSRYTICAVSLIPELEESECPNVGLPETMTVDWCIEWAKGFTPPRR